VVNWLDYSDSVPGFMSREELTWLHDRAATMQTVVEIGTWKGRSGSALAAGCPGKVWCIDHFRGSPDQVSEEGVGCAEAVKGHVGELARKNLARFPNVTILEMTSRQAADLFEDGSVDMVFIDGTHGYRAVISDLIAWRPKARKLFCGHDADWGTVRDALRDLKVEWTAGPDAIWYVEVE